MLVIYAMLPSLCIWSSRSPVVASIVRQMCPCLPSVALIPILLLTHNKKGADKKSFCGTLLLLGRAGLENSRSIVNSYTQDT